MSSVVDFIRTLYPDVNRGLINIWTLENQQSRWIAMKDLDSKLPAMVNQLQGNNVYYSVGLQAAIPDSGRGTSEDVVSIPGLWIDVDTMEGPHKHTNIPADYKAVTRIIKDFPTPSLVVASGGGYHIFWLFDKPLFFMDSTQAKELASGWYRSIKATFEQHGYHLDNVSDLSRVLRLPLTYNLKDPNNPKLCMVIEANDIRYSVDELKPYIKAKKQPASAASNDGNRLTVDQGRDMLSYIPQSLDYMDWVHILYALYIEYGKETAITLAEEWSPGFPGEVESKIDSFDGKEYSITAGTLIYHAKSHGWKPEKHNWEEIPISEKQNSRYVRFDLTHKLTLVRSAKGTGKTEQLKQLIKSTDKVLLIGHRNALLQSTAIRLGLDYHHNSDAGLSSKLAITLDSLFKIGPSAHYDIVILDEVEQVLHHATGSTLKDARMLAMEYLSKVLTEAKHIIALDADLSIVAYNFFRRELPAIQPYVIDNQYKLVNKEYQLFETKASWLDQLKTDANDGKKLFIAANSRQAVKTITRMLEANEQLRILSVTADNSMEAATQAFIADINNRVSDYDIIIASPSMGTGISIDVPYFDRVYLLGESEVNTHADLLQQAARVRNIKDKLVCCWISPKTGYQPLNPAFIRDACLLNHQQTAKILGIQLAPKDAGHITRCATDERYLGLYADVIAWKNMSINNLKEMFIQAVKAEGCTIHDAVESDDNQKAAIRADYTQASDDIKAEWYSAVASAEDIEYAEYKEIRNKTHLTAEERAIAHKFTIRDFYGLDPEKITATVVEADSEGLRTKIFSLSLMTDDSTVAYTLDKAEQEKGENNPKYRLATPDKGHYAASRDLRLEIVSRALPRDLDTTIKQQLPIILNSSFADWVHTNRIRIYGLLKIKVRSDISQKPMLFLGMVLDQLGLKLISKQERINKKVIRKYTIEENTYDAMLELISSYRAARARKRELGDWVAVNGGLETFDQQ